MSSLGDAISLLKATQIYDFLHLQRDEKLTPFLEEQAQQSGGAVERLLFSDEVVKINRKDKRQRRALVLTDAALYNFSFPLLGFGSIFNNLKRRIPLASLSALVLSRCSDEVVFQVVDDYDYRFVVQRRAELVEVANQGHQAAHSGKQLPIHFSQEMELKNLTRTKEILQQQRQSGDVTDAKSSESESIDSLRQNNTENPDEQPPLIASFRRFGTVREGWLAKKKGRADKWEQKYLILTPERLTYHTARIKGNVSLVGCRVLTHTVKQSSSSSDSSSSSSASSASSSSSSSPSSSSSSSSSSSDIDSPLSSSSSPSSSSSSSSDSSSNESKQDIPQAESKQAEPEKDAAARRMMSMRRLEEFQYFLTIITADDKTFDLAVDTPGHLEEWVTALQSENKSLQGWLMKKDPTSKLWRRRFFFLRNRRLWFYEMNPKGEIELVEGASANSCHHIQQTIASSSSDSDAPSHARFAFRFNISESDRLYHLAAATEVDMQAWIAAIEHAARQFTKGSSASICVDDDDDDEAALAAPPPVDIPPELWSTVSQEAPENQVTFVFTDVQNSTNLWESAPDEMNDALEVHDAIMREQLARYRGYEVKTEGDAFMVTFFTVIDAILWCLAVQRALLQAQWPARLLEQSAASRLVDEASGALMFQGIRVRMGVHTGFPNCRRNPITSRMDYFGPVVNLSARISDTAHGGQVVCSEDVQKAIVDSMALNDGDAGYDARLKEFLPELKDHGSFPLKGIKDLTRIFQVSSHDLAARPFPPLRAGKK